MSIIFSLAVPFTLLAFYVGGLVLPQGDQLNSEFNIFDYISVPLCGLGVFLYNWFPERPVKVSI